MNIIKLPAVDRPKQYVKFTVTGSGYFPVDMLRYDACFPRTSQDVSTMLKQGGPNAEHMVFRTVEMNSYQQPTLDRWASFGWKVE